jgi:hypothetical protein
MTSLGAILGGRWSRHDRVGGGSGSGKRNQVPRQLRPQSKGLAIRMFDLPVPGAMKTCVREGPSSPVAELDG